MIREHPSWFKLYFIGAAACLGLFLATQFTMSESAHRLLLIVLIIAAYSMIAHWLNSNSTQPPPIAVTTPSAEPIAEFLDEDRLQIQQAYEGIEFPSEII